MLNFRRKSASKAKKMEISPVISGSAECHVHMTVDTMGRISGVPEEWKDLIKDAFAVIDLPQSEENMMKVTNIVQTSLKRDKTVKEGKSMKVLLDSASPILRTKKNKKKNMKLKEVVKQLQEMCQCSNPWEKYELQGKNAIK